MRTTSETLASFFCRNIYLAVLLWSLAIASPILAQDRLQVLERSVPAMSAGDEELLDLVQRTTFEYFHAGAQSKAN